MVNHSPYPEERISDQHPEDPEMALVNIKCPNCGGSIELDNKMERAFCLFCGSPFLVKDEIQRIQIQHTGSITISNDIEPLLKSAVGFCKLKKWPEATQLYQKMIVQNSTDYRGWWGLFLVKTQNMTLLHRQDGVKYFPLDISDARNAIEVAPPKAKIYLTQTVNDYLRKVYDVCRVQINIKPIFASPQKGLSIKIDNGSFAYFPLDKPITLMIPRGDHLLSIYSETQRFSDYQLHIDSNLTLTIKSINNVWKIMSSQKM